MDSKRTENLCCLFQRKMEQESRMQWPFMWAVYNYLISTTIYLFILFFWEREEGKCEINFWACDPEKIVNCKINFCEFAENLWNCRNYFGEKSKRLYFDNQTLLTLDYSLIPSVELIFTFHSWNKPLTPDTLSSSVKSFLALLITELIFAIRRHTVWFCEINFCECVKNLRKINPARNSPALLGTNKVVLPWNIAYDWL